MKSCKKKCMTANMHICVNDHQSYCSYVSLFIYSFIYYFLIVRIVISVWHLHTFSISSAYKKWSISTRYITAKMYLSVALMVGGALLSWKQLHRSPHSVVHHNNAGLHHKTANQSRVQYRPTGEA